MKNICAVEGVYATGIKEGKYGLALIKAKGTAAAVFTKNRLVAAPVILMKERMEKGVLDGIIINSGNANVYTGEQGIKDAKRMCEIAAEAFGTTPDKVGVASTGVIGRFMKLDIIEDQCKRIKGDLKHDDAAEEKAMRAIMTTDTVPKSAIARRKNFTVAGICKGSGMIAPNMGTMLSFIYTDAEVSAADLKRALVPAVNRSFNMVVVDGDTSTNDCCFVTATGLKGRCDYGEFAAALEEVCISLAKQIAADGEGASKMIEVRVTGAKSESDAAVVARTVIESPLVKTAIYGEDPNWGRLIAAAGRAGIEFDTDAATVSISSEGRADTVVLARKGEILADDVMHPEALAAAKKLMGGKVVVVDIDIACGNAEATAWGCDLTEKYVEINGKYTT